MFARPVARRLGTRSASRTRFPSVDVLSEFSHGQGHEQPRIGSASTRRASLVCFTSRKLTEVLHRRVQSALCHFETWTIGGAARTKCQKPDISVLVGKNARA